MSLSLFILCPLLTALLVFLIKKPAAVRWISLGGAIVQLGMAVWLLMAYFQERALGQTAQFLFEEQYTWFSSWNISYHIGVDGISVGMILLTAIVVLGGFLVSWNVEKLTAEYYFLLTLLALGAYGFFISLDLMLLFFFLEVAVIPKYLLIVIWGSGRKEASANKLALMLMGGSALVLVAMLGLYFYGGHSFDIRALAGISLPSHIQKMFFPLMFAGFGVFTAMFPFHTWVPDGHSSAPTAGSMFLAGISMKLGGYGCLRAAAYLMPEGAREFSGIIIALSAIAILYGAFATMLQSDMKYMNAYSSISHCGFVLLGIGMMTTTAVTGAVMQMVSHGLMTALFFAVIGMVYERSHTRIVNEMQGLQHRIPFIITVMYLSGLCSLGLPGLSGFVSEMTVFMGSWEKTGFWPRMATVAAAASIVVTAVYILKAVTRVAMGPIQSGMETIEDARWNERLAAVVLMAGILAIGLAPAWLSDLVRPDAQIIVNRILGK